MSEQNQEQQQNDEQNKTADPSDENAPVQEADSEGTTQPNEHQQPTPAGDEFAQEGGPTVQDQAANAMHNEAAQQQQDSGE